MANYLRTNVLTSGSEICVALDGIEGQQNEDVCYVQETNRYYRWFAASTTAANGITVVIPDGQDPGVAGRWFVQGPPGQANLIPEFPARIPPCTAGSVDTCAEQDFTIVGADGTAVLDLSAALTALGSPVSSTVFGELKLIMIQAVDGQFPVAETHPVAIFLDAAGNVEVSGAVVPVSNIITNPDPAAAQVQGGIANFAGGSVNPTLAATATGADQNLTVTYTPGGIVAFTAGRCQLCLGPVLDAAPAA